MIIKYASNTINVADGTSLEEVKRGLVAIYPELANATSVEIEGGYEFKVQAGTKGADTTVVYGDNRFTVPGEDDAEIKAAVSAIYPELANGSMTRVGSTLTFTVQAGTKGN